MLSCYHNFLTINKHDILKVQCDEYGKGQLISKGLFGILNRDVTTGKLLVQPLRWWGRICPPGWNRVKGSGNLGATVVASVASSVTSLIIIYTPT